MAIGHEGCSHTRTLGRKRVVVSNDEEAPPLKRMCSGRITLNSERSSLEAFPHDILVKVLCGVDHEDLDYLSQVSKTIREATHLAIESHFGYHTPKKNTLQIYSPFDMEDGNEFQDIEAPNAPLVLRKPKSRLNNWRNLGVIPMPPCFH